MGPLIVLKLIQGVVMADGAQFDATLVTKILQTLEEELKPLGYLSCNAVDQQTVVITMDRGFVLPFMTRISKIEFEVQAA